MQRFPFLLLAVVVFFSFAWLTYQSGIRFVERERTLAATYLNDSQIVEFVGAEENNPPVGSGGTSWPSGTSVIVNDSVVNLGATQGTSPIISDVAVESILVFNEASDEDEVAPVITTVTVTTESFSSSATPGTTPTQTQSTVLAEEILATLLGSGAITAIYENQNSGGSTVGGSSGSILQLRFFGDRVRDAFRSLGIVRIAIPQKEVLLRGTGRGARVFSQNDFALFVSSAVLEDQYIDDVVFANGVLTTRYKAFGRLFGFIPTRYPLVVSATFAQGSLQTTTVRFPWYSFVLAKGTSERVLKNRIEAQITENIKTFVSEYDVSTRAFVGVTDVLRGEFGEI
ncbi:MAG: hypothetical protein AAB439_03885 [Patescibacteria group bacterium]